MENFIEYSLPYKLTVQDQCKRALYTVLPMALGVFLIMWQGLFGVLLCAGCSYAAYRIFMSFYFEWEYTLLENEITFTRIINKERRKELLKADIAKTERYGVWQGAAPAGIKTVSFLSHQGDEPEYYWITETEKGEKVCVLFQPTPAVREVFSVRARGKLQ